MPPRRLKCWPLVSRRCYPLVSIPMFIVLAVISSFSPSRDDSPTMNHTHSSPALRTTDNMSTYFDDVIHWEDDEEGILSIEKDLSELNSIAEDGILSPSSGYRNNKRRIVGTSNQSTFPTKRRPPETRLPTPSWLADIQGRSTSVPFSRSVTEWMMQNMSVKLPPLLSNYKNPCWLERHHKLTYDANSYLKWGCRKDRVAMSEVSDYMTSHKYIAVHNGWRLRCFPYFFVLGVMKCGTTDLFEKMRDYLQDFVPGGRKEPQFWDRRRFGEGCKEIQGHKYNFSDYLDLFDEASVRIILNQTNRNGSVYHSFITGDFTPANLWYLKKWRTVRGNEDTDEPRVIAAHHLHSIRPQAKLIVILRNPVERAYSHYRCCIPSHSKDVNKTAADFHRRVLLYVQEIRQCFSKRSPRACAYDHPGNILVPGLYYIFIKDWLAVFPWRQFLFIKFEDYIASRSSQLQRVLQFLEIDHGGWLSQENRIALDAAKPKNKSKRKIEMLPETRVLLEQFYKEWTDLLTSILDNDNYQWF